MKLAQILIQIIKESGYNAPTPVVKPTVKPGVQPDKTPIRRPLAPPKHAPRPRPKAEGVVNKITQRYKKLKGK